MTKPFPTVATRQQDGVPVVMAAGEFDASTAPELRSALDAISDSSKKVIVDLSNVTFLDSTALGALVYTAKRLSAKHPNAHLVLVVTHPHIMKVFEVTGLDHVFAIVQ